MKALKLCLGIAIIAYLATSCTSTSVNKNTRSSASAGYTSARLLESSVKVHNEGPENSPEVHNAIQRLIGNHFKTRGLLFGGADTDLIIAYMIVRQEIGMTTVKTNYFGPGRDANAILAEAERSGAIQNIRPDVFKTGTLVIDIIDAKTNKLVFRGHTKADLLAGVKPSQRDARINEAVAKTLAPFFN